MEYVIGRISHACPNEGWAIAMVPGEELDVFLHVADKVRLRLVGSGLRFRRVGHGTSLPIRNERVAILGLESNGHRRLKALAWCSLVHFEKMKRATAKAADTLARKAQKAADEHQHRQASVAYSMREKGQKSGKKKGKGVA